jgi:hypothetical protein
MSNATNCEVTGKRKYLSEREAQETAAYQMTQPNAPKELKAYLCNWCETWHLTKNSERKNKGRKSSAQ